MGTENWPRKVFLESTALFQLGSKLEKPEFAKLTELRRHLKFDLFASEVSWAEYTRQRTDKIDELLGDIKSVGARMGEWNQDPQNILATHKQLKEFRRTAGDLYAKRAKDVGIQVLGIPNIDVRRLFRMSIERTAPFEKSKDDKSEKGFRDALIMFTILENIKERPEDFSVVVCNDGLLTEGLTNHIREYKTDLTIVPNLDEAIAHIDARVDKWYREYLAKESEAAKAELDKYTKEISEQVSAIRELTDADLGIGTLAGMLGGSRPLDLGESVERVNSLKLDQTDSAVWSDKDKPESRILFRIRCTANVVTSVTTPFWAVPAKYAVGAEKQPASFLNFITSASAPKQEREREIPVKLYGEAKLHRIDGDWKLATIRVDKSQPSWADMATLAHSEVRRIQK